MSSPCFFGTKCHRKNPKHFQQYAHPDLQRLLESKDTSDESILTFNNGQTSVDVVREQLRILGQSKGPNKTSSSSGASNMSIIQKKLALSEPFRVFLTKVKDSKATHRAMDSVFLTELLHPSLGRVKRSCQINFMVDMDFLMMGYEVNGIQDLPMLILYGEDAPGLSKAELPKNISAVQVKSQFPYGKHHTKMMIVAYEDESVRVIILTANMVASDWENRTQGLWISPRCKSSGDPRDSPTGFKADLLRYLKFYEVPGLRPFIDVLENADFHDVNACFISSVPGAHKGTALHKWGHLSLRKKLRDFSYDCTRDDWPVIIQCSSIGSLGPSEDKWMLSDLIPTLSSSSVKDFKVIYPSKSDVMSSYDGPMGGACLPYSSKTHAKQLWLRKYLYHWRSASRDRNSAMPHIKTYTRLSPEEGAAPYFLLTSSNLSKAAWGSLNKAKDSLLIMSYEAGVLFLPKFTHGGNNSAVYGNEDLAKLLPYDLSLSKYKGPSEEPWFMENLY